MDLFIEKSIQPMLIGAEGNPFDDAGYVYELKLDGERCIAYLAPDTGTDLRNKRNMKMLPKVPELDMLLNAKSMLRKLAAIGIAAIARLLESSFIR